MTWPPPTQHGITLIDLVVVNLYPFVQAASNPRHPVRGAHRGDRHRRPEPGARRGQELPGRARGRLAGGLRGGPGAARPQRRAEPGVPLRPGEEGVCAHRRLRHGDRLDARDDHRRRRRAIRAAQADRVAARCSLWACTRFAICGTARTRTRWRPGTPRSRRPASARRACCRARSCRTRTCSISTRPRASSWSSASRRRSSSSTRTRAARPLGSSATDAYVRAREADALAAFGGIVGLNRPIDADTAPRHRVDVHRSGHRAVGGRGGARDPRGQGRTCAWSRPTSRRWRPTPGGSVRSILGAVLVQSRDRVIEAASRVAARRRCAW